MPWRFCRRFFARLNLGTLAFDSNSIHGINEKQEFRMELLIFMVETIGIEPMTPCTSSRYSNQLS